jgi:PAS domain S-box-containing protein
MEQCGGARQRPNEHMAVPIGHMCTFDPFFLSATYRRNSVPGRSIQMNNLFLVIIIILTTGLVALLDFSSSGELIGSILFTFPLALCALQNSKRVLWATAATAVFLTAATEFWGFNRGDLVNSRDASVNRGILILSLLVLATFIHFWINRSQKLVLDAKEIKSRDASLVAQNRQLEALIGRVSLAASVARLGVWECDLRSKTLTWDATMFEIYGIAPIHPVPYEKWASAVYSEDIPAFEAMLRCDIDKKNQGPVEFRISLPDGSLRNIAAMKRAVLDEHGNAVQIVGVNMDITERKQTEAAFRESEERFRILVGGVQDYAIFTLDPHGNVVSWNAGAERIKGYKADEIIGQNFSRFYSQKDIDEGKPEEELLLAVTSGRSETEHWRVRKDGSLFWANVVITAARDSSGRLVGFSEISRDISERKETEAKYRGLLEAAPDAMVVVNQAGEIVLLNLQAEKQFGYHRDELLGQKVKNIIPEGFAERLIADGTRTAAEALAQQIGTGIELSGRRKDGTEFPIEIMLSPLESAEGILVTAAIRNISLRKAAEKHLVKTVGELKRSNDELQQFAYVASHDLQEPLRMVASYTQLLAKRYKGRLDSDADEFIGYAVDGSNRMQELIQDLLSYSRAGSNGKVLLGISAENALKDALANLRATINESGAIVTHDSLPAVTSDDTQLTQIFQNLVGNAIKYRSAEIPHVHVSATKNGLNEWIFSVHDNGLGIDPQYFDRIFILFQRLHGREERKGSGIGLAICKKILERLGGRIWVESKLEMGSTFFFSLPQGDAN